MAIRNEYTVVDLSKPLQPETLNGVLVTFDNNGMEFRTKLTDGGANIKLMEGDIFAYFQIDDGYVWRINGYNQDGEAYLHIPNYCLTKAGRFTLTIKYSNDRQEMTLRVIRGNVIACVAEDAWKDILAINVQPTEDMKGCIVTIVPMADTQMYQLQEMSSNSPADATVGTVHYLYDKLSMTFSDVPSGSVRYFRAVPRMKIDSEGHTETGNPSAIYTWQQP